MKNKTPFLVAGSLFLALAGMSPVHAAVDAAKAEGLMKTNKCGTCHAVDKNKTGPSLKSIAAKYKGKADGEEAVIKAFTTGPKVKLEDGTQEEHKILKTKDPVEIKNLAEWILSQ